MMVHPIGLPTMTQFTASKLAHISRQGIKFHAKMSGCAPVNEGFLRDWCAVRLHTERRAIVNIEVTSSQFANWYQTRMPKAGCIDMIVSSPSSTPEEANVDTIIEFKMTNHMEKIAADIRRTSTLLKLLPGVSGFQVVCTTPDILNKRSLIEKNKSALEVLAKRLNPYCQSRVLGNPFNLKLSSGCVWFGAFIIKVLPSP